MEIHLTPDQEARLVQLATREGRAPQELAREAIARFLEDGVLEGDAHFAAAVALGLAAADRGEFVESREVWEGVRGILRP